MNLNCYFCLKALKAEVVNYQDDNNCSNCMDKYKLEGVLTFYNQGGKTVYAFSIETINYIIDYFIDKETKIWYRGKDYTTPIITICNKKMIFTPANVKEKLPNYLLFL